MSLKVAIPIPKDRPASVTEICPGSIYAIGAKIPLAGRKLTWISDDSRGFLPIQAYVFRDAGQALMADTGLTVHRKEMAEGYAWTLNGYPDRRFVVTRLEHDAFINFRWLVDTFDIKLIYNSGELNPVNFFESFENAAEKVQHKVTYHGTVEQIRPGVLLQAGALRLEALKSSLRVLKANWLYEQTTGSLFPCDSFSFITCPTASSPNLITPSDEQISVDKVRGYLDKKFDWLRGIDSTSVRDDVKRIFDRRIERICPSYGCIIEGRAAVERVLQNTLIAMEQLSQLPPRSAMEGFVFERGDSGADATRRRAAL